MVVVGHPGAESLDIACLTTAFDHANRAGVVTPAGRPIDCRSGLTLQAHGCRREQRAGRARPSAGAGVPARRVGVHRCLGARRDGTARRPSRHHALAVRRPARRHLSRGPRGSGARPHPRRQSDHGGELARQVARGLVTYLQRPGNQAQMSMFVAAPAPADDLVREIVVMVRDEPDPRPQRDRPRPATCASRGPKPPRGSSCRAGCPCNGQPSAAASRPPRHCARLPWPGTASRPRTTGSPGPGGRPLRPPPPRRH